jgi:hypothetical protein
MAEKIAKLGIKREPGWLYFLRGSDVYKTPMNRAGRSDSSHSLNEGELVCLGEFERETDKYIYFLDAHGDVSRAPRPLPKED